MFIFAGVYLSYDLFELMKCQGFIESDGKLSGLDLLSNIITDRFAFEWSGSSLWRFTFFFDDIGDGGLEYIIFAMFG